MAVGEAIKIGTLFRSVSSTHPVQVKRWMLIQLARVVHRVAAKTTVEDDIEYVEIARAIYRNFPTLRIEEMEEVFNGIVFGKYGKYYERLKAAEFMEAFRQHEASEERVMAFETAHKKTAYAVAVHSHEELENVLIECSKRGYVFRKDNTEKDTESPVLYVVIDGGYFDYEAVTDLPFQTVHQFKKPLQYAMGGRIEARVMTNGERLREALKVDTKVMAEYIMRKPNNGKSL